MERVLFLRSSGSLDTLSVIVLQNCKCGFERCLSTSSVARTEGTVRYIINVE